MAELVVRYPFTAAGSTYIASTGTKVTWYRVFSDLSSTQGMVLGTAILIIEVKC